MYERNENYYKKVTKQLFRLILVMVVLKVFIDNGSLSFFIPAMKDYNELLSFVFVVLIYVFYILGGLLTFNKNSHIYFYFLSLNILGYAVYYSLGTNLFTESFDYAEQLQYYSEFSMLFTIVTAVCTLGIFKEHFAKRELISK